MKLKIALATLAILLLTGQGWANETTVEKKVLFYGGTNNPPFEFINEKGEADGFHVELFYELMSILGIEYELRLMEWNQAVKALKESRVDGLIGHLQSNQRMQYASFTIPTSYVYATIIHRKEDSYKSPSDAFGKNVLVMAGCKSEEYIEEHNIPIKTTRVDGFYDGFKLLEDGRYDLMVTNDKISAYYLLHNKKSNLTATTFNIIEPLAYCIAVANNNPELLLQINHALRQLKMSGRFDEIHNKWLLIEGDKSHKELLLLLLTIVVAISLMWLVFAIIMKRKIKYAIQQLAEEQKNTKNALEVGGLTAWEYNCKYKLFKVLQGEHVESELKQRMSLTYFIQNIHPDNKEEVIEIMHQIESQQLAEAILKYRFKTNNEWRWFLSSYIPVTKNGKVISLMGVRRDITWEVENEEVMQERIKEVVEHGDDLTKILDNISTPIALKSMESNRYIYANKTALELIGPIVDYSISFKIRSSTLGENGDAIRATGKYEATEVIEVTDGRELITMVKSVVIDYNNQPHALITRIDLTEINKAKNDSRLLSEFLPVLKGFSWQLDSKNDAMELDHRMELERDITQITQLSQLFALVHEEDKAIFLANIEWLKSGDLTKNKLFQYRIDIVKRGKYEWWESFTSAEIHTKNDKDYRIIRGITVNIDERKKAELELQHLHKQHELVLNNMSSTLVHINSNYEVIWSNAQNAVDKNLAFIYQPGKKCYKLIGLNAPCAHCPAEKAMESGFEKRIEFSHGGNCDIYEATASPLRGDLGIEGAVIKIDNITEHKKLISDLETANQLMTTLLDELPAIFFMKDAKDGFKYVFASSAFCETVANKPREEIIGYTDYDVFEDRNAADKFREDDLKLISCHTSGEVAIIGEERIVNNNEERILDTKKLFLELPNSKKYLVGQSSDITEIQQINKQLIDAKERAEKADKLKSAFLANMSHEIRTPLNAIVGFSQLLQESDDKEERIEFSNIIQTNNDLLLRLISDILDLSKLDAGAVVLKPEEFDLSACMEETYTTLKARCQHSDVELRLHNPYTRCIVTLDKNRCLQIITNYLNNAVKFTLKGFIEIGYEYKENGLILFVKDTGIGITEEKAKNLFQRFQKLDDFAQGTGLGLSICKAIAETMHGRVWAVSEEGKGSTFFAWIPCEATIE